VLGVNHGAVSGDVEHASAALQKLGLNAQLFGDLGRQTGGARKVVSARAVLDRDAHDEAP
jgi:hypothetical protein